MKEENQNGKERQMAEEQIDFRTLLFKYYSLALVCRGSVALLCWCMVLSALGYPHL